MSWRFALKALWLKNHQSEYFYKIVFWCVCTHRDIKVNLIKHFIVWFYERMGFRLKCYNWIGFIDRNEKQREKWKEKEEKKFSLWSLKSIRFSSLLVYVRFSAFSPDDWPQNCLFFLPLRIMLQTQLALLLAVNYVSSHLNVYLSVASKYFNGELLKRRFPSWLWRLHLKPSF